MQLSALLLNCTLQPSPTSSSTDVMLDLVAEQLHQLEVTTEKVRVVDLDVRPGVEHDMGDGDAWPALEARLLAADILVVGTPIWLGSSSSVAKRVAERLDAMLGDADDDGRLPTYGKVAVVAVVGNEDGAHHVSAEWFQWLDDTGFTIAPNASVYWVGEAMGSTDFKDLDEPPEAVVSAAKGAAANAVHVARLLHAHHFPGTALLGSGG